MASDHEELGNVTSKAHAIKRLNNIHYIVGKCEQLERTKQYIVIYIMNLLKTRNFGCRLIKRFG